MTALAGAASLALVALPTVAMTTANAATQSVSITKSGYVPLSLSIKVGDTIAFTNADTAAHQVVFKQTGGFTCTVTPLVVAPTKTQSCTFTVADKYTYTDPNQNGRAWAGTITVEVATTPSVSLSTNPAIVEYGNKSTLSGKTTPSAAGTSVDIMSMATGETGYTKLVTVVTTAGGAFTTSVTPEIGTNYRAEFQSGGAKITSAVQTVQVRPNVTLTLRFVKNGRAYFTSKIISSITYTGKFLKVQRKNSLGGWTTLRTVTVGNVSTVRFRVKLASGISRIRTLLPVSQAGDGYLAGISNVVAVKR